MTHFLGQAETRMAGTSIVQRAYWEASQLCTTAKSGSIRDIDFFCRVVLGSVKLETLMVGHDDKTLAPCQWTLELEVAPGNWRRKVPVACFYDKLSIKVAGPDASLILDEAPID